MIYPASLFHSAYWKSMYKLINSAFTWWVFHIQHKNAVRPCCCSLFHSLACLHQCPPTDQCLTSPFCHLSNHHQPLKHDMKCVEEEWSIFVWCVCVQTGWADEQQQHRGKQRFGKKKKKSQVSSEADFTWRIKTERHAKWPNYCNEKQSWHLTVIDSD